MRSRLLPVSIAGIIICSLGWTWISFSFDPFRETGALASTSRPFALFFSLAVLGSVAYFIAIWQAIVHPHTFRLKEIIGVAVLCRLLLIPSIPIQEIDLYRYLWDGYVINQGVNPYRYTPEQIKQALAASASPNRPDAPPLPDELSHRDHTKPASVNPEIVSLVSLCQTQPEVHRILDSVHFSELPTVYPPVSEAVFALSVFTTPRDTSRYVRLVVLKTWLMLFDLLTLGGIVVLLKQLSIPGSWAVVYGWSPLVLKEYANSGHLDTITVAFSLWSVILLIRTVELTDSRVNDHPRKKAILPLLCSAVLFACSIAGKLYPLVLTPVLLVFLLRRLGTRLTGTWLVTSVLASFLFLSPWIFADLGQSAPGTQTSQQTEATAGLKAFMTRWQINDWIFSVINENILPDSQRRSPTPWFVFVPDNWREAIAHSIQQEQQEQEQQEQQQQEQRKQNHATTRLLPEISSFLIARAITLAIWGGITVYLLIVLWREPTARSLVHQSFLVLAWFWLLAPTQNPWYWTWAIPFLLPSHRIAWLGISSVLFAYYVRFPLLYFETNGAVPGTAMSGWTLFSDVVVWLEFAPLMLWILFYKKQGEPNCD